MKKKLIVVTATIALACSAGVGYAWYSKPPVIHTDNIELQYGEKLNLERIHTSNDVVSIEIVDKNLELNKLGNQLVTIKATNARNVSTEATINVYVVDKEAPIIEIKSELITEAKEKFNLRDHISVTDNVEGDMTGEVEITPFNTDKVGIYQISLEVSDASENKTEKTVDLKVVDSKKPELLVSNITLTEGESFDLHKGIKAEDLVDGDLTAKIEVSGEVDKNKAGTYPVTYKVQDLSGNENTQTINVVVNKKVVEIPIDASQVPVPNENKSSEASYSKNYEPMTLYFNGKSVPYSNGGKSSGQSIIDKGGRASTWGGASIFSATDGLNTHFIGHNPGPFAGIENAKSIVITDRSGTAHTYIVTKVYRVNDYAVGIDDGVNYWNRVTGTDGGERVTFQSCFDNSINWIVEAVKQ